MTLSAPCPIPRTALVTGATGLLGTNLVRFLVDKGLEVGVEIVQAPPHVPSVA